MNDVTQKEGRGLMIKCHKDIRQTIQERDRLGWGHVIFEGRVLP